MTYYYLPCIKCYSYRFFGLMCAAPFSTTLYSWLGPKYGMLLRVVTVTFLLAFSIILTYSFLVFALLSCLPFLILPLVFNLGEVRNAPVASTREQCGEIWTTVCSRAVWQPLGFVYLYNVLQVGNVAWKEFLKTTLGFTSVRRMIVDCLQRQETFNKYMANSTHLSFFALAI